jgi:transcription antitermination protein NusB
VAARRKARKRALDLLFEAEQRGLDPVTLTSERLAGGDPPVPDYAVSLVEGVVREKPRIDELLSTYAEGWTLERMPAVDRGLLRIALYELLWSPDIPDAVAVDEAVELAKELSTDDSPRFINGLLGRILLAHASS